jgi:hypothetical protein
MIKRFVPDPTRRRGPLKGINHSIEAEMLEHAGKMEKSVAKVAKKRAKAAVKVAKLRGA